MNSIIFGGIDSSDYGIYISGEGVWNAPERDAETIQIPGRNGEYVLDKGNFKNIKVTYPAFNQETSYNDFRTKVDNFRNAISSLKGYQRLTDSFHPDEYRMAAFIGGLEVKPVLYNDKSMEMNIVFNCKPQRFLTSGETEQTVTSGGTVTNPTLFESSPLLEIVGYGDIGISGETITVNNYPVGRILLSAAHTGNLSQYSQEKVNSGDPIIVNAGAKYQLSFECVGTLTSFSVTPAGIVNYTWNQNRASITYTLPETSLVAGISNSITFDQILIDYTYESGGESHTVSKYFAPNINYRTDYKTIALATRDDIQEPEWRIVYYSPDIYAISSVNISALGIPIYIDLDIGEVYSNIDGVTISANSNVKLPADLPTFNPGVNTITYGNTFTSFKVTPRWWKV